MVTTQSLSRTLGPDAEPVSLAEARDQCEIIASDTVHDIKLARFIAAAREQVETDTDYKLITQTFTLSRSLWPLGSSIPAPVRPIQSIDSITYYDEANSQQTLATSVYGLDAARRVVYLKNDQEWPSINGQHNGIAITMTVGFGDTEANVPRIIKQACLLVVAKWFAHRGDESKMPAHDTAYERIIQRLLRTSYP